MADNINYNDANELFFLKAAESRFNDYVEAIIEKDIDIIPKLMDTNENHKDVHKYIKNLFLCCTENDLCNESFRAICYTLFKDGFNLAMNMRLNKLNG